MAFKRVLLHLTAARADCFRDYCTKMSITTEKLIENVKNYKILYDLSHPEYKNNRRKNKTWDEIGALLNTDGEYLFITNKMYNRYFIFIFGDASNYLQFNAKC